MSTDLRAADLPEGSVVANETTAWIKIRDWWYATRIGTTAFLDEDIDQRFADGAVVLRVGTGEGAERWS